MAETSTWIGAIGLIFWFLNLKTFLFILFVVAIFIPETAWDKFTAEKTKEIKDHMNI